MQTNLKSDDFCGYNIEAAPFYWVMQAGQYNNNFSYGEEGVNSLGGAPGSYIPRDVVDISSFLSGRDNILTRCSPPTPSLDAVNEPPLTMQSDDVELLVPIYTKDKRSSVELSAVDYNRWVPLYSEPQNLRHIIPELSAQRGGLNTKNYVKASWNQENFSSLSGNGRTKERAKACMMSLDPARFGPGAEGVTGYPGTNFSTGVHPDVDYVAPGKPPKSPAYPFIDITSQDLYEVGAAPCGEQFFYGAKYYDKGSCPEIKPSMLNESAVGPYQAYNS